MEPHGLHTVLNFLEFLTLFALFGLLAAKAWLVPSAAFLNPELFSRWREMLLECLGLMMFASVALLLVRTAEMDQGNLLDALYDLPTVILQTHFGAVWCFHLLVLGGLWWYCARFTSPSHSIAWCAIVACAMLALGFTFSASSHASDTGDFTLAECNDWLHVIATALWGGTILATALLLFPVLRTSNPAIPVIAARLSNLAGFALVAVLATGLYNASLRIPNVDALIDTNYGRVLCIKLAVVSFVALVGACNRFWIVPRVRRLASGAPAALESASRLLFRILILDVALVVTAVIMASILIQMENPTGIFIN